MPIGTRKDGKPIDHDNDGITEEYQKRVAAQQAKTGGNASSGTSSSHDDSNHGKTGESESGSSGSGSSGGGQTTKPPKQPKPPANQNVGTAGAGNNNVAAPGDNNLLDQNNANQFWEDGTQQGDSDPPEDNPFEQPQTPLGDAANQGNPFGQPNPFGPQAGGQRNPPPAQGGGQGNGVPPPNQQDINNIIDGAGRGFGRRQPAPPKQPKPPAPPKFPTTSSSQSKQGKRIATNIQGQLNQPQVMPTGGDQGPAGTPYKEGSTATYDPGKSNKRPVLTGLVNQNQNQPQPKRPTKETPAGIPKPPAWIPKPPPKPPAKPTPKSTRSKNQKRK